MILWRMVEAARRMVDCAYDAITTSDPLADPTFEDMITEQISDRLSTEIDLGILKLHAEAAAEMLDRQIMMSDCMWWNTDYHYCRRCFGVWPKELLIARILEEKKTLFEGAPYEYSLGPVTETVCPLCERGQR